MMTALGQKLPTKRNFRYSPGTAQLDDLKRPGSCQFRNRDLSVLRHAHVDRFFYCAATLDPILERTHIVNFGVAHVFEHLTRQS